VEHRQRRISLERRGPSHPRHTFALHHPRVTSPQFDLSSYRFSVAMPLGINGAARHSNTGRLGLNNRQPLPYLCSCGSKNRAGRSLPQRRPATNVALGPAGFDPTKQHPIPARSNRCSGVEVASKRRCASPPHPGAAGRPLTRGLSYSLAAQSTAQPKTQSTAPCPPHCGSAIAPPVPLGTRKMGGAAPKRRPRQFLPDWPSANRQNMPS